LVMVGVWVEVLVLVGVLEAVSVPEGVLVTVSVLVGVWLGVEEVGVPMGVLVKVGVWAPANLGRAATRRHDKNEIIRKGDREVFPSRLVFNFSGFIFSLI